MEALVCGQEGSHIPDQNVPSRGHCKDMGVSAVEHRLAERHVSHVGIHESVGNFESFGSFTTVLQKSTVKECVKRVSKES